MPEDSLHGDKVDNALEGFFGADGNLDGAGICTEHILDLAHYFEEVCTRTVHLVNVTYTGHVIFVGLTPHGFRLGFNTAYGAERGNGAVENAERTLDFNGEVNVPRGVNQVDFIFVARILPESGGSGRGDGDTTLLFLLHPVHSGSAVMNFSDLMRKTGIEQNTLGSCGLTGIDMSHNADISGVFK